VSYITITKVQKEFYTRYYLMSNTLFCLFLLYLSL
jgi:hypothetical protein